MSTEKIIYEEQNLPPLKTTEIKKFKFSGRVDVNHLFAKVRLKKQKENKINLIFFSIFVSFIIILGTILSF